MENKDKPPTNIKSKSHRCYFCGVKFFDIKALKKHIPSHRDRPYECTMCDWKFAEISFLRKHLLTHGTERPFMCEICGKTFIDGWNLKKHIERHDSKNYQLCLGCRKKVQLPNVLCPSCTRLGKRVGDDGTLFCVICNSFFESTEAINSHMEQDKGCGLISKHFQCLHCKQSFKKKHNYEKHISNCGQGSKTKSCSCKNCQFHLKTSGKV